MPDEADMEYVLEHVEEEVESMDAYKELDF